MQAQWKQNLGIVVPLRSMEFKTFSTSGPLLTTKVFRLEHSQRHYMDPSLF